MACWYSTEFSEEWQLNFTEWHQLLHKTLTLQIFIYALTLHFMNSKHAIIFSKSKHCGVITNSMALS